MVAQKITAFRDFAGQLAAQVVEQLCGEFEREVQTLWNDVLMYRGELDRVAQLLGKQLEREQKLHGVIEQMVGHSQNVHQQAQWMASQRPGSDQLHQWLEQHMSQHADLLQQTVNGVGQASAVLQHTAANTTAWKQEAVTAENEFMRIVELLRTPPVPGAMPAPTIAALPSAPGSVNIVQPPPQFSLSQVVRPNSVPNLGTVPAGGTFTPPAPRQAPISPGGFPPPAYTARPPVQVTTMQGPMQIPVLQAQTRPLV